jgi:uncharacterized protein
MSTPTTEPLTLMGGEAILTGARPEHERTIEDASEKDPAMLHRTMPKTGDSLSILGFGAMRLPGGQFRPDEAESIKQIRSAIDQGVNYIDTAWPYHGGKSEAIVGKALTDGYRAKVKIADKLPYWLCESREDMDYYLDAQLERLGDTVIDYYLIHAINGAPWKRMVELGVIDFLDDAKASGKIIHAGFSFHGARDDFKAIVDGYDWEFCQIQLNILDEHNQAGVEGLEYAASKDIGVIVMEPLRGGLLAGKQPDAIQDIYDRATTKRSNAEWALRWVWNHPGVITVLSGMNTEEQIAENTRVASDAQVGSLTEQETDLISEVRDKYRSLTKVPCTGCQYCMPCPRDINIPLIFSLYNEKHLFGRKLWPQIQYLLFTAGMQGKTPARASQCVTCGKCIAHCPQGIDIPAELANVRKEFEKWYTKPLGAMLKHMLKMGGRKR